VPGLVVRPKARILHGHDWVYATEVLKTFGSPAPGDVVSLKDGRDHLLGSAIYNPASQIVARRISRHRQDLDPDFFARRIARAVAWRERSGCDLSLCRLVWSEADGMPGVIADRYRDVVVLQTAALAMDNCKAMIAEELSRLDGVSHVVERNDAGSRVKEGLSPAVGALIGEAPGSRILEIAGARFEVDFLEGHKTGLYLDQAANCRFVAEHSEGLRVLDCFSNQGGFALACAAAGASAVTAVESGGPAAARLRSNAELNGRAIRVIEEDVFRVLPDLARQGETYDLVILDPPSFTKAKGRINDALRGYRELHRLAAPLLSRDGLLATFCCSHHVPADEFLAAAASGMADAKRSAHLVARMTQPADHPVALHIPETEYLKGFLFAARQPF